MNILIVGGTGTIGTHLVHSLSKQNHKIFLLSRNPEKYYKKFNQNIFLNLGLGIQTTLIY
ncbi:MAG: hypothetical protein Ct9H90mP15_08870 [Candidatus Neomarinimicrobiota bacterium]|nr:MAG: hypothetical protein Ct9H90mP15_08870 [Candidatus Neomarinimicrobiota bacterium]